LERTIELSFFDYLNQKKQRVDKNIDRNIYIFYASINS